MMMFDAAVYDMIVAPIIVILMVLIPTLVFWGDD